MRRNVASFLKLGLVFFIFAFVTLLLLRIMREPFDNNFDKDININTFENIEKLPFESIANDVKIDWHDYEKITSDSLRAGPGEQGKPADESIKLNELVKKKLYDENGFNAALSDKISLNRSLPDIRNPGCKTKKYLQHLPKVSVIVPFHNEHWSTLLRTAQSVLNRSPSHLITEIILVDDASTKEFLKLKLDDYLSKNMPKVRVLRMHKRSGLIRARLAGAKQAKAEVLIFLDSHTEANVNWLPPLLEPIALDYKTCMCPFIDVIAFETFEYRAQDEGARGAFDWEFYYKRLPLLPEDLAHPAEPFKSPIMAGGLFAISAKFFWELGGYDEGLDIWGGEQYELSFKIWQCGGQMLDAPCSRVGHIYRKFAPFPNPGIGDFIGRNYKRVAEVWMDGYKEYLYDRKPHYRQIDAGDLTAQKAVREKWNCKPFKWFIENIAFDLPKKYPPVEPDDFAKGEIRSVANPQLCVDTKNKQKGAEFGLDKCLSDKSILEKDEEQIFIWTWHSDIRPQGKSVCWDVSEPGDKAPVTLFGCHGSRGNQLWNYDKKHQWLVHGGNPRCLDADVDKKIIFVSTCDPESETQRWIFEDTR